MATSMANGTAMSTAASTAASTSDQLHQSLIYWIVAIVSFLLLSRWTYGIFLSNARYNENGCQIDENGNVMYLDFRRTGSLTTKPRCKRLMDNVLAVVAISLLFSAMFGELASRFVPAMIKF